MKLGGAGPVSLSDSFSRRESRWLLHYLFPTARKRQREVFHVATWPDVKKQLRACRVLCALSRLSVGLVPKKTNLDRLDVNHPDLPQRFPECRMCEMGYETSWEAIHLEELAGYFTSFSSFCTLSQISLFAELPQHGQASVSSSIRYKHANVGKPSVIVRY